MTVGALQLRRFAAPIPSIADDWFNNPVQTISVTRLGDFSASADGACRVQFAGTIVGFVKPRADAGTPVVANEKIASDLGHMLDLPVAPVVIRAPQDGTEWDRHTSLSLACLASGRHWGDAAPAVHGGTAPALEALRVFWTWIGDTDHNQHPNNLMYEVASNGRFQLLSIDHSYMFGQGADPLTHPVCTGYGADHLDEATDARRMTVDAIEACDGEQVKHIVRRLVGAVLTDEQAQVAVNWLLTRRGRLRALLNVGGDND